jgi:hypothetical protein
MTLLCIIRLTYYYDAIRFRLKDEARLTNLILRIAIRNLIVYLIYDQDVYFKVLTFNVVETTSFAYVMFIVAIANMMFFDAILLAKILVIYLITIRTLTMIFV